MGDVQLRPPKNSIDKLLGIQVDHLRLLSDDLVLMLCLGHNKGVKLEVVLLFEFFTSWVDGSTIGQEL